MAFEILDIDKDGILNVLDLIKIQSFFEEDCELAVDLNKIMEIYKDKNVRPKYIREEYIINFETFNSIIHRSCIIKEL